MCRAMEITYEEGLDEGLRKGRAEGRMEGRVDILRTLMRRHGFSAEEAMDELEIPDVERTLCAEMLENRNR